MKALQIRQLLLISILLLSISGVNVQDDPALSPRVGHKMVVDSGNDQVILFGGNSLGEAQVFYDDTWIYSPESNIWTQLMIDGPSPRGSHALTYNPDDGTVLLFGGQTPTRRLSETWVFDCNMETWIEIETEISPEGRSDFDMVYDSSRGVFILYGGWGDRTGFQDDTWVFDPETNTWSEIETNVTPGRMYGQNLEYYPVGEKVILYGGHLKSPISRDYVEEAWYFYPDNSSWVKSSSANTPHGRYWNSMSFSSVHSSLVVFGGTYGEGPITDTWILSTQNMVWTQLDSNDFPSNRVISDMVYVDFLGSFLLFGGVNNNYEHYGDTWKLSPETWEWEELLPTYSSREAIDEPGMMPGYPVTTILAGMTVLYLISKRKLG